MSYLELKPPEVGDKGIVIGNRIIFPIPFSPNYPSVPPAIEKCPQNLTSNTSDPNWEISSSIGTHMEYQLFDGDKDTGHGCSSQSGSLETLVSWVRTDGISFPASTVFTFESTYTTGFIQIRGITASGDRIILGEISLEFTKQAEIVSNELIIGYALISDDMYLFGISATEQPQAPVPPQELIPQKCLIYGNYAIPLYDYPEGMKPNVGDKCMIIPDKNLCVPVYFGEPGVFPAPTDGLVYYAPFSKHVSTAETGQTLLKYNSVTYTTQNGIPCVYCDNSSVYVEQKIGGNQMTASIWVKGADPIATRNGAIFSHQEGGGWGLFFLPSDEGTTLHAVVHVGGAYVVFRKPFIGYSDDEWMHIALTLGNGTMSAYINGEIFGSVPAPGAYKAAGNSGVIVGCAHGNTGWVLPLTGWFAGARIYNRALTESEIAVLANEFTPTP